MFWEAIFDVTFEPPFCSFDLFIFYLARGNSNETSTQVFFTSLSRGFEFLIPELLRVGLLPKFHGESDLKFKARKVPKFRRMGWDGKG